MSALFLRMVQKGMMLAYPLPNPSVCYWIPAFAGMAGRGA